MSSWIHCNVCGIVCNSLSQSNDIKFFLSSCGHLSCSSCCDKRGKGFCSVCGKQSSKVYLTQPLPAEVVPWVTDPLPSMRKLKEAYKFQMAQYSNLLESQLKKYAAYCEELVKKKQFLENRKKQLQLELSRRRSRKPSSNSLYMSNYCSWPGLSITPSPSPVRASPLPKVTTPLSDRQKPSPMDRQIKLQTPASMRLAGQIPFNNFRLNY